MIPVFPRHILLVFILASQHGVGNHHYLGKKERNTAHDIKKY